jgi:hypothetical protein
MNYFKGSEFARMSDGSYCIIRDLGLVKGGKGLRHHETLLSLRASGLTSQLVRILRRCARFLQTCSGGEIFRARIARSRQ